MSRLLFIDIFKIIGCLFILAHHICPVTFFNYPSWTNYNIGAVGVIIFTVVSGYAIEYGYGEKLKLKTINVQKYLSYIWRRITRIYPAFWLSSIMALTINPMLLSMNLEQLFYSVTGFNTVINGYNPLVIINPVGWYVGVIMVLYVFYPLLSYYVEKWGLILIIILWFLFLPLGHYFNVFGRVFEFSAGIYARKKDLLLPWKHDNKLLTYASELSFYVFLFHYPLLFLAKQNLVLFLFCTMLASIGAFLLMNFIVNRYDSNVYFIIHRLISK